MGEIHEDVRPTPHEQGNHHDRAIAERAGDVGKVWRLIEKGRENLRVRKGESQFVPKPPSDIPTRTDP